jgi:hypothetical protein
MTYQLRIDPKRLFAYLLLALFCGLTLFATFGCKKESFYEYRVTDVQRPGTFACKYTLSAKGKPDIVLFDECGKYKSGQVVLRVEE